MRYFLLIIMIIVLYNLKPIKLEEIKTLKPETISVEVKGNLKNPGIFEIKAYSKFEDLLKELQLNPDSSVDHLSLNKILINEEIIVVNSNDDVMVSINSGSLSELSSLKGIGEVIAQRIITYRSEVSHFNTLEDLKKVKGIGEKVFENIKDFITL